MTGTPNDSSFVIVYVVPFQKGASMRRTPSPFAAHYTFAFCAHELRNLTSILRSIWMLLLWVL